MDEQKHGLYGSEEDDSDEPEHMEELMNCDDDE
jgi:hypothetical protein